MNLEEELLRAKHIHKQMIGQVDMETFEKRLFQSLDIGRKASKKRPSRKRKIATIGIPILILPLVGFAYAQLVWNKVPVSTEKHNIYPFSSLPSPYQSSYLEHIKKDAKQIETLSTARTSATFPIREPASVPGWTRTISEGVTFPQIIQRVVNHKTVNVGTGETPLVYLDVYSNPRGQKVSIEQSNYSGNNGGTLAQIDIPTNAKVIPSFSGDIAWFFTDKNAKRFELNILHKESNGEITHIQVDGDITLTTLQAIAKAYLQSPKR